MKRPVVRSPTDELAYRTRPLRRVSSNNYEPGLFVKWLEEDENASSPESERGQGRRTTGGE